MALAYFSLKWTIIEIRLRKIVRNAFNDQIIVDHLHIENVDPWEILIYPDFIWKVLWRIILWPRTLSVKQNFKKTAWEL